MERTVSNSSIPVSEYSSDGVDETDEDELPEGFQDVVPVKSKKEAIALNNNVTDRVQVSESLCGIQLQRILLTNNCDGRLRSAASKSLKSSRHTRWTLGRGRRQPKSSTATCTSKSAHPTSTQSLSILRGCCRCRHFVSRCSRSITRALSASVRNTRVWTASETRAIAQLDALETLPVRSRVH